MSAWLFKHGSKMHDHKSCIKLTFLKITVDQDKDVGTEPFQY